MILLRWMYKLFPAAAVAFVSVAVAVPIAAAVVARIPIYKLLPAGMSPVNTLYRVNSKYVTILKPQDLQEVNKPKMWLNILNSTTNLHAVLAPA
jgi:hypothetical protein